MATQMDPGATVYITQDVIIEGQTAFKRGEALVIESVVPNPQRPEYRYVVTSPHLQKRFQLSDAELMMPAVPPPAYEAPNEVVQGRRGGKMWLAIGAVILVALVVCVTVVLVFVVGGGSSLAGDYYNSDNSIHLGLKADGTWSMTSPSDTAEYSGTWKQKGKVLELHASGTSTTLSFTINGNSLESDTGIALTKGKGTGVPTTGTSNGNSGNMELESASQRRTCQSNLRTIDSAINAYNGYYDAMPPNGPVWDVLGETWLKRNPTCPTSGESYTLTGGTSSIPPTTSCPTNEPGHSI